MIAEKTVPRTMMFRKLKCRILGSQAASKIIKTKGLGVMKMKKKA